MPKAELVDLQIRERIGDKWTVRVVSTLGASRGPVRFGQLGTSLGVAPKVLTDVLRSLKREPSCYPGSCSRCAIDSGSSSGLAA